MLSERDVNRNGSIPVPSLALSSPLHR